MELFSIYCYCIRNYCPGKYAVTLFLSPVYSIRFSRLKETLCKTLSQRTSFTLPPHVSTPLESACKIETTNGLSAYKNTSYAIHELKKVVENVPILFANQPAYVSICALNETKMPISLLIHSDRACTDNECADLKQVRAEIESWFSHREGLHSLYHDEESR